MIKQGRQVYTDCASPSGQMHGQTSHHMSIEIRNPKYQSVCVSTFTNTGAVRVRKYYTLCDTKYS